MMKRLLLVLSIAIGALLVSPTPEADARGWSRYRHRDYKSYSVPELDPNAAGGAMVLLLGGVAVVASRRRKGDTA